MSDMVLLASKDGSKVATVACPICGRISCQILMDEYRSSSVASLRSSHTCPVCELLLLRHLHLKVPNIQAHMSVTFYKGNSPITLI